MDDHDIRAVPRLEQRRSPLRRKFTLASRDRVAVRIVMGTAQAVGQSVDIFGRKTMFGLVGTAVPLVAGHSGLVGEISFVDAMGADDLPCLVASGIGELDTLARRSGEPAGSKFVDKLAGTLQGNACCASQTGGGGRCLRVFGFVQMLESILQAAAGLRVGTMHRRHGIKVKCPPARGNGD